MGVKHHYVTHLSKSALIALTFLISLMLISNAQAFTVNLNVVGSPAGAVGAFRWLVEEDTTHPVTPGVSDPNSLSFSFHGSHAPVVASGDSTSTAIELADGKKYYISVLPDTGYTIGGGQIADGQAAVTVICNQLPLPTAQISVLVFHDNNPINNAPDPTEAGLAGFKIVLEDAGGRYGMSAGQQMMDAFGNMIGTVYQKNPDGSFVLVDGVPQVETMGDGFVLTDDNGEVIIKNLHPSKYGIIVAPPAGEGWFQTSTIEGKKVIDAWVKADEPPFFTEFGPAGFHVFVGFVKEMNNIPAGGTSTVSGQVVNLHISRPPALGFFPGQPRANTWVGLNEGVAGAGPGLYAAPCDPETGEFTIPNVPPGTYQLVFWDEFLNNIFAFLGLTVTTGGAPVELGQVPVLRWFGTLENTVFYDANENGFRDANETYGLLEQAVNIRWRDGTMYQSAPTDGLGEIPFEEVFPFFHWLVAEVDFLRFKATGATMIADDGGAVSPGLDYSPQPQDANNPNTGDNLSRTETGPVLTQAFQLFLGQTNVIEWGKKEYAEGENGGISGIVFYATTRAENDPRYAAGEPWEPGIPRVQVNLYADGDIDRPPLGDFPGVGDLDWNDDGVFDLPDGTIDDADGDGSVTLADVDNHPLGWADGGAFGLEDVDRNSNGVFDAGDAIQVTTTDSWDDNLPTECPGDPLDPFYDANQDGTVGDCYDGLRNFNQIRPGVFDGGYAFDSYFPGGATSGSTEVSSLPAGTYIVETTVPPGHVLAKEEDRNVDFGDTYTPSLLLLPPVCVNYDDNGGQGHLVPAELSLFPGEPAPFAGTFRPECDRKQIMLSEGFNGAVDFFVFTTVPKAGRIVGIILNDLANEFDPNSPSFGEKFAPPWLPVSIRDYKGREIGRVYSDEFGSYNALVPSTFTENLPVPSGISPNMLTVVMNDPFLPDGSPDLQYNPQFSTFSYTFQYMPGVTTYLDTPVLPIAAFASPSTFPVDAEMPTGTPVIAQVDGDGLGPYVTSGGTVTIHSLGTAVLVRNPDLGLVNEPQMITRGFGFGVAGTVTIGGVDYTGSAVWDTETITVSNVTNGGQVVVTHTDTGLSSIVGITLTVGGGVTCVAAGGSIQTAIDAAVDGDLILVEPGIYAEQVILYKNIRLQGSGIGATTINAFNIPAEKPQLWKDKVEALLLAGDFNVLDNQEAGANAFKDETGPGIAVLGKSPANGGPLTDGRIDGFAITGADQGGAIFVNGYTQDLIISNNKLIGNQGFWGGGIRIGHPDLTTENPVGDQIYVDAQNDGVIIRYNHIAQNGGLNGAGGGVSLHTGADNYQVLSNFIVGNFTSGNGAGIGHLGLSSNGTIAMNTIAFNQSFNQGLTVSGGGLLVAGQPTLGPDLVGPGSGAVLVQNNKIQGNLAGAGDGGGIAVRFTNQDAITVHSNIIVNNVTGLAGGGISLVDAANVSITSNTIANNDSTATASLAFNTGPLVSTNQPAGIAARAHSAGLNTVLGVVNGFSDPTTFTNNILWQNRAFHWDVTTPTGLIPDIGAGDPATYWDLGVLGAAGSMNPMNGVLTTLTGPDLAAYDASNSTIDPAFVAPYFNAARGLTVLPEPTTGIEVAIALDEGGNFIDLAFGPLTISGDYTPTTTASGATGITLIHRQKKEEPRWPRHCGVI